MKFSLIGAVVLLAMSAATGRVQAQTYSGGYPVCIQVYTPFQFIDCRFNTIEQCQVTTTGRSATCVVNPFFVPRDQPRRRRR